MNPKIKETKAENLFKAILTLETVEDCYSFFEDVCTIPEIKAMAQRYNVAEMLSGGSVYSEIVKETGASTATISRVNRSLEYGSDGYEMVFKRLAEK